MKQTKQKDDEGGRTKPRFSAILVTACGGDISLSIGKLLKMENVAERLIGCDTHDEHPGIFIFDKCERVKRGDEEGYLESISRVVERHGVELVIPMSEPEISFFFENNVKDINGAPLLLLNEKALKTGLDKMETISFLKDTGLDSPWTIAVKDGKPPQLPCIIKKRFGSGSKGLDLVTDENLEHYMKTRTDSIFQEYLIPDDEEYTCGLYRTRQGEVRTIIFRRKLKGGFTGYGTVVHNRSIEEMLSKIAENLQLSGSINVQLRLTDKGPVVFEINPRFSSTVLFRHLVGFTDLIWALEEFKGGSAGDYTPPPEGTKIYKGFQEYVILPDKRIIST
jgi:carbamoyl-phosphate synthase large subunit